MQKVLCVPDLHLPWVDSDGLSAVYLAIEREKPTVVIQLGDLYDMYAHSKFPRNQDLCTPKEEICEAREGAENFWNNVKKMSASIRRIQILGNHDSRPSKRIQERYPEIAHLSGIDDLFEFPGVESVLDTRCEFQIDGVIYTHGHFTRHGQHAAYYLKSVVHGHTHRGNVSFQKVHGKIFWELDCGHLADEGSEPLQYQATKTTKWTRGFGIVDSLGPRFIPLG